MSSDTIAPVAKQAVRLKGGSFTITSLLIQEANVSRIQTELEALRLQVPHFFERTPVVIDLKSLAFTDSSFLPALANSLRSLSLIPIGVRHATQSFKSSAISAGLAVFPDGAPGKNSLLQSDPSTTSSSAQTTQTATQSTTSTVSTVTANLSTSSASRTTQLGHDMVIQHSIRSGQQIYAKGGNLVVLGSVSPGAEVLADGSIHVYGPLRGRALAGIQGQTEARIYCQFLDPELISIAGVFQVRENLDDHPDADRWAQVYLDDEKITVACF